MLSLENFLEKMLYITCEIWLFVIFTLSDPSLMPDDFKNKDTTIEDGFNKISAAQKTIIGALRNLINST